jgi:hypothetical protein
LHPFYRQDAVQTAGKQGYGAGVLRVAVLFQKVNPCSFAAVVTCKKRPTSAAGLYYYLFSIRYLTISCSILSMKRNCDPGFLGA